MYILRFFFFLYLQQLGVLLPFTQKSNRYELNQSELRGFKFDQVNDKVLSLILQRLPQGSGPVSKTHYCWC